MQSHAQVPEWAYNQACYNILNRPVSLDMSLDELGRRIREKAEEIARRGPITSIFSNHPQPVSHA